MVLLILRSGYADRIQQCPDRLPAPISPSEALYLPNVAKLDRYPYHYMSHWGSMSESSKKPIQVNKSSNKGKVSRLGIVSWYETDSHSGQPTHQGTVPSAAVIG